MSQQTAGFAAGCFWGVEARFREVEGVHDAVSGYMGGHTQNPTYQEVCSGETGHAEVVQVAFDDEQVSYRELLEQSRPGVNVALMVGHSNIRASVMGYAERNATANELRRMEVLLEDSLEAGAIGFSTGLVYTPVRWSSPAEVKALCQVAGTRGAIYTSHMRSESGALLEAIDEVLALGRETGARCQISHLKASGKAKSM